MAMWPAGVALAITAGYLNLAAPEARAVTQHGADYWCRACKVLAAGPAADTGKVYVLLEDPAGKFDKDWFVAEKGSDQILATAQTALTFKKTVTANLTASTQGSTIDRIYLESTPGIAGS